MKIETPLLFVLAPRFKKLRAKYEKLLAAVDEHVQELKYKDERNDPFEYDYSPLERLEQRTKSLKDARMEKQRLSQFESDALALGYEKVKKQPDNYQHFAYPKSFEFRNAVAPTETGVGHWDIPGKGCPEKQPQQPNPPAPEPTKVGTMKVDKLYVDKIIKNEKESLIDVPTEAGPPKDWGGL